MPALTGAKRIHLFRGAADTRRSFDRLCGRVCGELRADPVSGPLFFCRNHPRAMVKLLH
ncbi:MAG: IS66 family insertion sequence element accessory protein TnpB [Candidatus Handelsmanbacteria bacterium]|nr:IS66 family insertion sequence element accessory protein TnpB [Candidatus Handelsmanbacteria bacterium]